MIPFFSDVWVLSLSYAWTISSDILAHRPPLASACDWYVVGHLQCFYLLHVDPFSCCIQDRASCSNLLTVLVKLLSQVLSLIETCSLWLWHSANHSCSRTSSSWPIWSTSLNVELRQGANTEKLWLQMTGLNMWSPVISDKWQPLHQILIIPNRILVE